MRIECEIYQLMITEMLTAQRVVLKEKRGDRLFPIFIGPVEIAAIDRNLKGQTEPRPMTHDVACEIIAKLGGKLVSVRIKDLRDNIFYADIEIETARGLVTVDSRPSDAMALAAKTGAKIYVEDHVIDAAQIQ